MSRLNVYLAAPYAVRDQIRVYAEQLAVVDIAVTSRWLKEQGEINAGLIGPAVAETDAAIRQHCANDFADIDQAAVLVVFTGEACRAMGAALPEKLDPASLHTGGRHIETGYALAKRKKVVVIGPAENVFHRGVCQVVTDWHWAILALVKIANDFENNKVAESSSYDSSGSRVASGLVRGLSGS